jgi:hypothetical protein
MSNAAGLPRPGEYRIDVELVRQTADGAGVAKGSDPGPADGDGPLGFLVRKKRN